MRLNARTGAALLAIVVGLALVVFAALGSRGSIPGTRKAAPPIPITTAEIPPLAADTGIRKDPNKKTEGDKALENLPGFSKDAFATEYGDKGKHEVTVSVTANGRSAYLITWRGGKSEKGTAASLSRTRTIVGGFPIVQVLAQVSPAASRISCTITVDGVQKVEQSAAGVWSVVSCLG
jgi:hypothetical protein